MQKILFSWLIFLCFIQTVSAHNENKMILGVNQCLIARAWFESESETEDRFESLYKAIEEEKQAPFRIHELEEKNGILFAKLLAEKNPEAVDSLVYQHLEIEKTVAYYTQNKLSQIVILLSSILCIFMIVIIWLALVSNSSKHKAQKEKELNRQIISAQELERRRIARELHDTITQDVRTALLYVRELKSNAGDDGLLEKVESLENQNLKNLREIIQNLTSVEIEKLEFGELIAQHCASVSQSRNITCNFFTPEEIDFSCLETLQKLNIFRIIQEAVNNSLKHAQADSISIIVRQEKQPHKLYFFISDDGKGMELPEGAVDGCILSDEKRGHYGLRGMKDRADILGGSITISSSAETGTEIKLVVPVK